MRGFPSRRQPITPYATVHLKQELEQVLQRPVDLMCLPSDNQMGNNSHESKR